MNARCFIFGRTARGGISQRGRPEFGERQEGSEAFGGGFIAEPRAFADGAGGAVGSFHKNLTDILAMFPEKRAFQIENFML